MPLNPQKNLGRAVKIIEYALVRLEPACTSFRRMVFGVRGMQRRWLDLVDMISFLTRRMAPQGESLLAYPAL
jgi:hypothetical protein